MKSIQALREARAAKAKELQPIMDEKHVWNAERDQPIYDRVMAEIDAIDAEMKRVQAFNETVARDALNSNVTEAANRMERDNTSPHARLYAKWLRGGDKSITAEEWQTIRAAMSTTTGAEGGYTVATEVASVIIDALKKYGGMRSVASVISTEQGNAINYPNSDGTNEEGEIVAENGTASDDDVDFGYTQLGVFKYSSKVVPVPIELLTDSSFDLEPYVNQRLVTRLGRITNKHFTIGAGTNQPKGIMVAAPVGVTAANSTSQVTTVTYASLVDLQHSVDPAYRNGGQCRFMMHDNSVRQLRKILDAQGRPIFVPGYETGNPGGAPDRLLGDPIVVNQDVAQMAANASSIAYGDFSKYVIRDVLSVTLQRFADSAYAKKGQVGFLAWLRTGGAYVDVGGAVKRFVNAAS